MKKLKCMLLVDDDPIVIFINTSLINRLNISEELLTASNGQEALSVIEQHCQGSDTAGSPCPELILLDISMPAMNGFEFLEAFEKLELSPRPHVVLLTNSMSPKDLAKAQQYNLAALINKPLTAAKLTSVVEQFQQQKQHL